MQLIVDMATVGLPILLVLIVLGIKKSNAKKEKTYLVNYRKKDEVSETHGTCPVKVKKGEFVTEKKVKEHIENVTKIKVWKVEIDEVIDPDKL